MLFPFWRRLDTLKLSMKSQQLFGTDGIRGKANTYPIDPATMRNAGQTAGSIVGSGASVIIGKDTRSSSDDIETALADGLKSQGVSVSLAGYCPTPALAFLTSHGRYDMGIMITASHNPASDNGVKFFASDGFKISTEQERTIEKGILDPDSIIHNDHEGSVSTLEDALEPYRSHALSVGPQSLDGLNIVVDCSHGGSYEVAPRIFEELGAHVIAIGIEPDGQNINDGVGSQAPAKAIEALKTHSADLAVIFDGDADRVILIDEKGEEFDGDNIMLTIALHLQQQGKLQKDTLVATTMSNVGLENACKEHNITLIRTDVGDIAVVREMREHGYNVGGEQSGHVICLDHTSTGDGIVASLQILAIMQTENKKLSELRQFTPFPQILHNVVVKDRTDLSALPKTTELIESLNSRNDLRVNVRYSGTELLLRIMVEGQDKDEIKQIAQTIQQSYEKEIQEQ